MISGVGQVSARASNLDTTRAATAARNLMPRDEFFAALFIVGCANGLAPHIISSVIDQGWKSAVIGSFGISALVWVGCIAGISLILRDRRESLRRLDFLIGAGFLILTFLPSGRLSWLAVTALSIYLLSGTSVGSPRWRGAVILFATTVPMLWSPILFAFFSNFILEIDAWLGACLSGTSRVGNMIRFADNSGYLVIFPPCSSLANTSLAFLSWVTISQLVRHRWSYVDPLWCLLACVSVVAVNATRISLMASSQRTYEIVHSAAGGMVINVIILCLTIGISAFGVRRELFARF